MKRTVLCCLITTAMYAASVHPQQLRCEYRANPQGIDVTEPRLSWILAAAQAKDRGLRQTAYRILVASSVMLVGLVDDRAERLANPNIAGDTRPLIFG